MSSVIIGIHGLANKPHEDTLKDWWHKAMLEGLKVNAGIERSELSFESVYWADVMYPEPDPKPDKYKPAKEGEIKRYKEGWLEKLKDDMAEELGSALEMAKKAFGIDKLSETVIDKKLHDLHQYYEVRKVRKKLRARLKKVITKNSGKRIMIVAHSMGTIIAYDTLRAMGRTQDMVKIDHFVTIGSPLGMPHVKLKIAEENAAVRTPSCVRKWTNFADRFDPVALDPRLADDFSENDRGVKVADDLVLNDWGGINHKSYGYLRTPEFTDVLKNFI